MFKWLLQQLTEADEDLDSLGSERGLDAFLRRVSAAPPMRAVEALGEPFENAPASELAPERLRRALLRLDEHAQGPLDQLWPKLFADSGGRTMSDVAWLTLARYYRNVHTGYRVCLDALDARPSDTERRDANLMACRAMACLGRYKQLLRLRYRDVDQRYWEKVNALAACSLARGGTHTLLELYPQCGYQSSIEREHLIALLFDVAPIGNFLPTQMAALDLLLRRFASNYRFSEHYHQAAPFVLNPHEGHPAQRWIRGMALQAEHRFFGIGDAYSQIASLRKQLTEDRQVPKWLAVTKLDSAGYGDLLNLLLAHWSDQPPQRRVPRERGDGEVMVAHGVGELRRMIAASEFARSGGQLSYQENTPYDYRIFERVKFGTVGERPRSTARDCRETPLEIMQKFELEGDRHMTERWALCDVSIIGVGATADAHGGWGRVGMLVGYRPLGSLDWKTGVIRRLIRASRSKLSIGVQTHPAAAWCARLRFGGESGKINPWAGMGVVGDGERFYEGILLHGPNAAEIILEPGVFGGTIECMLSYDKRWRKARLERRLETGLDYERIAVAFI